MAFRKLAVFSLLLLCCFCKSRPLSPAELLTSKDCACWNAEIGFSMCLCRDGKLYEYERDDEGKRVRADYGDFRVGQLRWKVQNDSLLVFSGETKMTADKIEFLSDKQLILNDSLKLRSVKRLVYHKSNEPISIGSLKQD